MSTYPAQPLAPDLLEKLLAGQAVRDELLAGIYQTLRELLELQKMQSGIHQAPKPSEWLTSDEVKMRLKIGSTTLYRLKCSGALVPHRIGTAIRYLASDVHEAAGKLGPAIP